MNDITAKENGCGKGPQIMVNHCIGDVDDKIVNFGIHLRASLLSGGSAFRVRAGHSLVVITIVPLR